jgi:hypothetical protein
MANGITAPVGTKITELFSFEPVIAPSAILAVVIAESATSAVTIALEFICTGIVISALPLKLTAVPVTSPDRAIVLPV